MHRSNQQRHRSKTQHHTRQNSTRTINLPHNPQHRRRKNIWHKKDTEQNIIFIRAGKSQIFFQAGGFGISEIGFVERIEEVHHGEEGKDSEVEFPEESAFGGGGDGDLFAIFLDYDGVAVGVFGDGACLLEIFFGGGDALLRFEGRGEFGVGFWCGHDF